MNISTFSRHTFRRAALASVVALSALGAASAFAVEATAPASAEVIAPIGITKGENLVFGNFAPVTGGTVTVTPGGTRTGSGSVLLSEMVDPSAARFDVTGDPDATYTITGPADIVLIGSGDPMALTMISDLTESGSSSGTVPTGTLSDLGAQSIYVGGVLTVGTAQAAGEYTGTVTVAVEYN